MMVRYLFVFEKRILVNFSSSRLSTVLTRSYTEESRRIINIPVGSNIYTFGAPAQTRLPLISDLEWTVREGEAWAVISGAGGIGKGVIFKTLLGHTRLAPSSPAAQGAWAHAGGLYPFLSSSSVDPYTKISHVSFRQRTGGQSGSFFDYTARYGAIREEEDRITLRQTLQPPSGEDSPERTTLFHSLTEKIGLKQLLDLPIITLSNGQTRRARVVKAILDRPEILLLDEPLTGLDAPSRKTLNDILQKLHHERCPRIILGLRRGEEVPPWITHVLETEGSTAKVRPFSESTSVSFSSFQEQRPRPDSSQSNEKRLLVDLKDVNVAYGDRKILKNINWQIRAGERWHLQGSNGSGKTTLLALLTGDHPQSYTQAHLYLPSYDSALPLRPRKRIPTAELRTTISVVSPEMFDAFPRLHPGMSVWEAVTTGFDGGFVPRTRNATVEQRRKGGVGWVDVADHEVSPTISKENLRASRVGRCWSVLEALGPAAWSKATSKHNNIPPTAEYGSLAFSSLTSGEQRLVLLMRALVGRPPVVLLDEVWSGMDDAMIGAARRYLRGGDGVDDDQAVVVITHWEDEVPWMGDEVKKFKLG